MIDRYSQKDIAKIWNEKSKFNYFLKVELALIKAREHDFIPSGTSDKIKNYVKINTKRIKEIEEETRHDIIAFCTHITEQIPKKLARFFHYGVTSSDIIDSALTLQIHDSLKIIIKDVEALLDILKNKATQYQYQICMGRSHGIYAEPMSLGQKFLSFYAELSRRLKDLESFLKTELTVQASGSVGNYALISPVIEHNFSEILGFPREELSTQIIPRDRIAKLIMINSLVAAAIERMAVEIRHLQRSEVNEISEGFKVGQKGSSIMPHKKNPIASENLTGISRIIKSHNSVALDNIVLWHERDISHSSAERLYLPDHFGLISYSLRRMTDTIENLVINKDNINQRVFKEYKYLSSFYLHFLIQKTNVSRDKIYSLVQESVFKSKDRDDFTKILKTKFPKVDFPKEIELEQIYLEHIDDIYYRFFDIN